MSQRSKGKQQRLSKSSFKAHCLSWYTGKALIFRFTLKFSALIVSFYVLSLTPICQRILSDLVIWNARLSSAILSSIGEGTHATDGTIWSPNYAITVLPACTGIEFSMFFCAIVIAFPSRVADKVLGILVGVTLLLALNLVRLISLYYIGVHFNRFFGMAHEELWGIPLVTAAIFLSAVWIGWARKASPSATDVPA